MACDDRTTPKDTTHSSSDQEKKHSNSDQEREKSPSDDKRQELRSAEERTKSPTNGLRSAEERTKSPTNGFIDIGKQQVEGYQDAYKDYVHEASQKEHPSN